MGEIICVKCDVKLELAKVKLTYLGREMHSEVLKCPKCGQVCFTEELVTSKIQSIEGSLEDK
jgi:acetyl-CoA carboxylase beta subunit